MKKKMVVCLACAVLIVLCMGLVSLAAAPNGYNLMFKDDFDGTSLNTEMWDCRSGNPYGGKNLAENVRVENGKLYLDYKMVDGFYTGGGVLTNFTLPYGYYETRALTFGETGRFHTSFWLSGGSAFTTRPQNFPQNNVMIEIDGFEIDSEKPDAISYGIHYWWGEHLSASRWAYREIDTSKEWFTMGMEWLPDRVNFYVNGQLVNSDTALRVYGPSYLWLTAAAMPEGNEHLIDPTKVNGSSQFEYVSYYQKKLKNVNLLGNGNFEYDCSKKSTYPFAFIVKGSNASFANETPYSYEGNYCLTQFSPLPFDTSCGQEFPYLCAGNYTFSGMFRTSDALSKSRIVVYDKNGAVLAEKAIPAGDNWHKVTLSDIPVSQYAYVAIESASDGNQYLMADDLSFFCQEGEDYTAMNTPDYVNYITPMQDDAPRMTFDNAKSYSDNWSSSSLLSGSVYASTPECYAEWELTIDETASYIVELYHLPHPNNAKTQNYIFTVNNGTPLTVPANMTEGATGFMPLTELSLNEGDVLKVRTEGPSDAGPSGIYRISQLEIVKKDSKTSFDLPAFRLNNPYFTHNNKLHSFNKQDLSYKPHMENNQLYVPYGPLKAVEDFVIEDKSRPMQTILKRDDAARSNGDWKYSSLMNGAGYAAARTGAYLEWDYTPPKAGTYAVDVYSICAAATTPDHKYTVTLNGESTEYHIDTTGEHNFWQGLGLYDLTPDDTLTIRLEDGNDPKSYLRSGKLLIDNVDDYITEEQINQSGTHYLSKIDNTYILHPVSVTVNENIEKYLSASINSVVDYTLARYPVNRGTTDVADQTLYPFNNAQTNVSWTTSGLSGGSYYVDAAPTNDPYAKWILTAPSTGKYSIQVYSPTHTNSVSMAVATLYYRGINTPFYYSQRQVEGWQDLGAFELEANESVEITVSAYTKDGFLRSKAARLVPLKAPTASISGRAVTLNSGQSANYIGKIMCAIYEPREYGLYSVQFLEPAETHRITLPTTQYKYKFFFWDSLENMIPLYPAIGTRP